MTLLLCLFTYLSFSQVTFPGVKQRTFRVLLQFFYTDTIPTLKVCNSLLEILINKTERSNKS